MHSTYTQREEGNHKLILVFAGWGTDPAHYSRLHRKGWDVLVCYDQDNAPLDKALLEPYDSIVLYAWSLGVAAADLYLPDTRLAAAYAVNGTLHPCHDEYGIPEAIFRGTLANLSEATLAKFRRRMFTSSDRFREVLPLLPASPDIADLRRQLEDAADGEPRRSISWRRAYISEDDRIFPAEAQKRAWRGTPVTILEEEGHCVDLQHIIDITIPDTEAIGEGFAGSLTTYDKAADPQRIVALLLSDMLLQLEVPQGGSALEIGHASGLFSRLYAPHLQPRSIDYIDLFPTEPLHLAPTERTIRCDAEEWIASQPSRAYDYLLSSSALQWFVDHDLFLRHCARLLVPGGIMACSLFIDGNLEELDSRRPAPISYLTEDTLRAIVEKNLGIVRWQVVEIKEEFDSRISMLRHIKETGVTPVSQKRKVVSKESASAPEHYTLTYRAVCFIATV